MKRRTKPLLNFMVSTTFIAIAAILLQTAIVTRAASSDNADNNKVSIALTTDHADGIYAKNESIIFTVKILKGKTPATGTVSFSLRDANSATKTMGLSVTLKDDGTAQAEWKQEAPSVVTCRVMYKLEDNHYATESAAAVVAPYEIQPTTTEPDDFMTFWNAQKAKLAAVPIDAKVTPTQTKTDGIELYIVSLANVDGKRVHGYLAKPKGDGPFPITLEFPSAGILPTSRVRVEERAAKGWLSMEISVHDLPIDKPIKFYNEQTAVPVKYYLQGRENRDDYYYRRVILGNIRAIDYLTSRSDWDHKNMIVTGASQGGGLSIITAGLDSRVTASAAAVAALCDHSGPSAGYPAGWPNLVPLKDGKLDPQILAVSRYYDAVNFARHIKVPIMFEVGLKDSTCRPTTSLSAFNVVKSTKKLYISPTLGHGRHPLYKEKLSGFIVEQLHK